MDPPGLGSASGHEHDDGADSGPGDGPSDGAGGGVDDGPSDDPDGGPGDGPSDGPGDGSDDGPEPPPGNTPVERHGALHVADGKLRGEDGSAVQLRGVSSMWLNWEDDGYAENLTSLRWMRDNWNLSLIRAAMGVDVPGAYFENPDKALGQVRTIVNNAIEAGVYVIIDWHDHHAEQHQAQATEFFRQMAMEFGDVPNVLYEPYNEPLQVSWSGTLKPYHQALVGAIREIDSDNVIILGTPNWSQFVDEAAMDPLQGTNLMYTLHFYSCTHNDNVRDLANTALGQGLPLFVTEWGASHADGGTDGLVCEGEANAWHDWMNQHDISWAAWKFDNCEPDSTCMLRPGAPVEGGWTDGDLRGHGPFVRDRMKN